MSVGFNVAFYKEKIKEEDERAGEGKKWSFFIRETQHTFPATHECRERHDIVCAGDEKWMISLCWIMNKNRTMRKSAKCI